MDGTDELVGLFPPGTRQDGDGMLMVGGCRLDDLAREYGTPVMVVAEDAWRRRARDYRERLTARWPDSRAVFASKAFPCTAVQRLMVVVDNLDDIDRLEAAPSLDEYLDALIGAAREHLPAGARILIEPGRSVVATNAVTVCTVTTIKPGATTFVAVDGGMADNLEVALVGQRFEATIANRVGGG